MTNIVDCEPDDVRIGMAVQARFEAVSDEAGIALFYPEPEPGRLRPGPTCVSRDGCPGETACPGVLGMGSFGMAPPA